MSKSVLEQLQEDIVGRLSSIAFLADVPIFKLREQHIDSLIEQALTTIQAGGTSKSGAAITVMMPLLDVPKGGAPGPNTDVSISVRAQEFPTINMGASGTQISAESMGVEIVQALHHYAIDGVGTLYAHPETLTPSRDFLPKITYIATLKLTLPLAKLPKMERVAISYAGGILSFSGNVGDVWYILGQAGESIEYPRPSVGGRASVGTKWTAPIAIPANFVIRWVNYPSSISGDPSILGSDAEQGTLT